MFFDKKTPKFYSTEEPDFFAHFFLRAKRVSFIVFFVELFYDWSFDLILTSC